MVGTRKLHGKKEKKDRKRTVVVAGTVAEVVAMPAALVAVVGNADVVSWSNCRTGKDPWAWDSRIPTKKKEANKRERMVLLQRPERQSESVHSWRLC